MINIIIYMQWVYIIICENDIIYVGETKNLFKRLMQHKNGGCKVTNENKVKKLIGLYKVTENYNFLRYLEELYEKCEDFDKKLENLKEILYDMDKYSLNRDKSLYVENYFTENVMKYSKYKNDVEKIYGGKYVVKERKREDMIFVDKKYNRPNCNCGLPCEVRKYYRNKRIVLNYTCSLRNVWENMDETLNCIEIGTKCSFYVEYLDDIELRVLF